LNWESVKTSMLSFANQELGKNEVVRRILPSKNVRKTNEERRRLLNSVVTPKIYNVWLIQRSVSLGREG